jgi:prophage maintenance system killer protein
MPEVKRFLAKSATVSTFLRGNGRVLRFAGDQIIEIMITIAQGEELGKQLYTMPKVFREKNVQLKEEDIEDEEE